MNYLLACFVTALSAYVTYNLLPCNEHDKFASLLQNKNMIITGASSGLGKEAAIYASKLGASLVLIARREKLLIETIEDCKKASTNPLATFNYIVFDFYQVDLIDVTIKKAVEMLNNRLDYLLLNHAFLLTNTKDIASWTGSQHQMQLIDYSMKVNFVSYVSATNSALHFLEKSAGCLLVVSSMIVEHAAFSLPYASSKGALNPFFSGLRQELLLQKSNVSIVIMHLGFIHTEAGEESLKSMVSSSNQEIDKVMSIFPTTSSTEGGINLVRSAISRHPPYVYYPADQKLAYFRAMQPLLSDPDYYNQIVQDTILYFVGLKDKFYDCLR